MNVCKRALGLLRTLLCFLTLIANAQNTPAIRVESRQVLVPAYLWDTDRCKLVSNLNSNDLQVFEDGKEQKIQKVSLEYYYAMDIHDNAGSHAEYSITPKGKWILANQGPCCFDQRTYLVAYVPPPSLEGSCHEVKLKVRHHNIDITAPREYCNTRHSALDPLNGTKLGKEMTKLLDSSAAGRIHLSAQAVPFYKDRNASRVHIAIEFPSQEVRINGGRGEPGFRIGILGIVYRVNGTVETQFSDYDDETGPIYVSGESVGCYRKYDAPAKEYQGLVANRYETQLDLPSGEYDLRLLVSDGEQFGRIEIPLKVDSYDGKSIGIGSVALSKQFHEAAQRPDLPNTMQFDFVPLVSKGIEFAPTGNTRFKNTDRLAAYFEVYEPLLGEPQAPTVWVHMRVADAKNGEIKKDFQPVDVSSYMQAGGQTIPISREIPIDQLGVGTYRLEVQASDSVGKSTVWRTANFSVQ